MNEGCAIGVITSLSGANEHIGRGILHSLEFGFKVAGSEPRPGIYCEDDYAQAYDAVRAMRRCVERGCCAVIGPADSSSMHAILTSKEFESVPIISTLASATDLASIGAQNFFRTTSPNLRRAEVLLSRLQMMYPRASVDVYVCEGPPESYAQSMFRDVLSVASKLAIDVRSHEYSTGRISCAKPKRGGPFVICAPSAAAVQLLRKFRSAGVSGQAFSFGSNTNFLVRSAVGTIVVCDLHREDSNPIIKRHLDAFFSEYPAEKDPSLSTMVGGLVLQQALKQIPPDVFDDVKTLRSALLTQLQSSTFEGLFGPLRFGPNGEMNGFEQIVLSKVQRLRGGLGFVALREREKPTRQFPLTPTRVISAIIAAVGAATGVISAMEYLFPR